MTKPTSVAVLPFAKDEFLESIRSTQMKRSQAEADRRVSYLFDYLSAIKAKSLVVEEPYVDGAYLDDFAQYYVKSFTAYDRWCRRLHFFSESLTQREVIDALTGRVSRDRLINSYLGFVVARPLPTAVVGRTLLAHYPHDKNRRHYPVIAQHTATLCGVRLMIRSLPFQQQDRVLAACATVALWSSFQHLAAKFGSAAMSPAEITRHANTVAAYSRALPSHGLNLAQMCRAVVAVGLEPEVVACKPEVPILSLIHGYLSGGIPVIAIVDIEDHGQHAITLAGFSLREGAVNQREDWIKSSPQLRRIGLRIDELYGHDDGIGPFARLYVKEATQPVATDDQGDITHIYFEGSWSLKDGSGVSKIHPRYLLIPIYHKVRLTLLDVQEWLTILTSLLSIPIPKPEEFEWDVRLTTVNALKESAAEWVPPGDLDRVILGAYPRFLWHARLRVSGVAVLDVLFDATDIEPAYPFCDLIFADDRLPKELSRLIHASNLSGPLGSVLGPQLFEFLRAHLPSR